MIAQSITGDLYTFHPAARNVFSSPGSIVSNLLPNAIMFAGVIFFILILVFGLGIITGAGKNKSPQEMAKGRSAFTMAVAGFLLVVASYFILQIIGVITGVDFANPVL